MEINMVMAETWFRCGTCHVFLSSLSNYRSHFLFRHKSEDNKNKFTNSNRTSIFSGHRKSSFGKQDFFYQSILPEPSQSIKILPCQIRLVKLPNQRDNNEGDVQASTSRPHKRNQQRSLSKAAKRFECDICKMRFNYPAFLQRHILTKHTKTKPFGCDHCEKRFSRPDCLKSHLRMHSDKTYYSCKHCDKSFRFAGAYYGHMYSNHTAEEDRPKFNCNLCPLYFLTKGKLATHQQNVHKIEKVRKHQCHLCPKQFLGSSGLKTHISLHTGEKFYKCDQCNKTFTQNSNLTTHKKTHTLNRPLQFSCNKCDDKSFATKSQLTIHINTVHDKLERFWCSICNKGFAYHNKLQNHLRSHVEDRPHKCDFCEKSFKWMGELTLHIKLHLDEKYYSCELCGKAYVQRINLESHKQKCGKERIRLKKGRIQNKWNM